MIDTIVLLVPKDKVWLLDKPNSSLWDLQSKTDLYDKYVINPTKLQKESGYYYPRITGYKRKWKEERNIKIEFSIPKLIYNNNLDEIEENQFNEVVNTLRERLKEMGLIASENVIKYAHISSVHYSKNIILKDGYNVNQVITELNKADVRKSFDIAKTRFLNNGQSLYFHTSSHEFVIYDKLADMKKDKKRAIDKDQTMMQRSLFNQIEKEKVLEEVLRFEARIGKKYKLDKLLENIGYNKNLNFSEVFKKDISQKILKHYWKILITDKNLGLFTIQTTNKETLRKIFQVKENIKPKQAIYLTGLNILAKEDKGMTELRSIIEKKGHYKTWSRIAKDFREISKELSPNLVRNWVKQIEKELENYKTLRIKDYEK